MDEEEGAVSAPESPQSDNNQDGESMDTGINGEEEPMQNGMFGGPASPEHEPMDEDLGPASPIASDEVDTDDGPPDGPMSPDDAPPDPGYYEDSADNEENSSEGVRDDTEQDDQGYVEDYGRERDSYSTPDVAQDEPTEQHRPVTPPENPDQEDDDELDLFETPNVPSRDNKQPLSAVNRKHGRIDDSLINSSSLDKRHKSMLGNDTVEESFMSARSHLSDNELSYNEQDSNITDNHGHTETHQAESDGEQNAVDGNKTLSPKQDKDLLQDSEEHIPVEKIKSNKKTDASSNNKEKKSEKVKQKEELNKMPAHDEHGELDYEEDLEDDHTHKKDEMKEESKDDAKNKAELDTSKEEGEMADNDKDEAKDSEDDGELSDDDCEEGEIKEPGRKPFVRPLCRFYNRGHCTWGSSCRFLHPGVNDKGNYSLIERPGMGAHDPIVSLRTRGRHWEESELAPPPASPPQESSWERGLRHAKELRKLANKRKETETNFEEKRLNLSLEDDKDFNKENDRSRYVVKDPYYDNVYDDEDDDVYGKPITAPITQPQEHWNSGRFENFEVRWTREPDFPPGPPPHYHGPPREHLNERRHKDRRLTPPPEIVKRFEAVRRQEKLERLEKLERYREHQFERPTIHRDERAEYEAQQRALRTTELQEMPARGGGESRSRRRPPPGLEPGPTDLPPQRPPLNSNRAPDEWLDPWQRRAPERGEKGDKREKSGGMHEWRDPWRRSKTPKGGRPRRSMSRSRSRGRKRYRSYSGSSSSSYSSGSSYSSRSRSSSYSSYSSRSSYSRSSSDSSRSSRSRTRSPRKRPGAPGGRHHMHRNHRSSGDPRAQRPMMGPKGSHPQKPPDMPPSDPSRIGPPGAKSRGPPPQGELPSAPPIDSTSIPVPPGARVRGGRLPPAKGPMPPSAPVGGPPPGMKGGMRQSPEKQKKSGAPGIRQPKIAGPGMPGSKAPGTKVPGIKAPAAKPPVMPPGMKGPGPPPGRERGRRRERYNSSSSSGSSVSPGRRRPRRHSSSYSGSSSASSRSSRSSSSSSSSSGSADSDHLYRDIAEGDSRQRRPRAQVRPKKTFDKPGHKRQDSLRKPDGASHPAGPPVGPLAAPPTMYQDGRPPRRGQVSPPPAAPVAKAPPPARPKPPKIEGGSSQGLAPNASPKMAKDPLKVSGQKSNIKLTLINKPAEKPAAVAKKRPAPEAGGPPPKKTVKDPAKETVKMPPPKAVAEGGVKVPKPKPASPKGKAQAGAAGGAAPAPAKKQDATAAAAAAAAMPKPAAKPTTTPVVKKKSASSRREELLKQLKAVEDAIARKRAKMT